MLNLTQDIADTTKNHSDTQFQGLGLSNAPANQTIMQHSKESGGGKVSGTGKTPLPNNNKPPKKEDWNMTYHDQTTKKEKTTKKEEKTSGELENDINNLELELENLNNQEYINNLFGEFQQVLTKKNLNLNDIEYIFKDFPNLKKKYLKNGTWNFEKWEHPINELFNPNSEFKKDFYNEINNRKINIRNQINDIKNNKTYDSRTDKEKREDSSYQRIVEDMRKAGLNPGMMFGSVGGGSPTGSSESEEDKRRKKRKELEELRRQQEMQKSQEKQRILSSLLMALAIASPNLNFGMSQSKTHSTSHTTGTRTNYNYRMKNN